MDKLRIIILIVVVVLLIGLFIFLQGKIPFITKQATVTINNHSFLIEVAKTEAQKEKGLSELTSLPVNHGMYFPFDRASFYPFWMKDMEFPLDIIYINQDKVVTVHSNVKPAPDPSTTIVKPTQPANAVLEINAGDAKKYNIKEGDNVQVSL